MLRAKRLDAPVRGELRHLLHARSFAIAPHGLTQAVSGGRGIKQRLDKRCAVARKRFELLMLLNRPARRALQLANTKFVTV
jgi:hypothetical protein